MHNKGKNLSILGKRDKPEEKRKEKKGKPPKERVKEGRLLTNISEL
jgi:hypothetical protein